METHCHYDDSIQIKKIQHISYARTVRFKDNPDGAPLFAPSDVILLNDGGRGGS